MLADEMPDMGSTSPATLAGTSGVLDLHVADAVFQRALDAGAEQIYPLADQFCGDGAGRVSDPFGHHWIVTTRVREVPDQEMVAAFNALFGARLREDQKRTRFPRTISSPGRFDRSGTSQSRGHSGAAIQHLRCTLASSVRTRLIAPANGSTGRPLHGTDRPAPKVAS
jgi:hypothetical protein